MTLPETLADLRSSGYRPRTVKRELRANLVRLLRAGEPVFPGVIGYDRTVVPQIQNAILSGHDFILLGLRGQAKTRILRALPRLLDERVPAVAGCEINDEPTAPVCAACRRRAEELGEELPLVWLSREDRYREKLATPDVTIADLIGDVDPIKAATRRLTLADPEVVHFGIVPRTNRGIFAINELPDLQARIQVGLLNILEEGDLQIRGFPVRLPMDVAMVFSANPEDYTNRGNIITPLRDRIASQILTHYPRTRAEGAAITAQEAWLDRGADVEVVVDGLMRDVLEEVAAQARRSEFVDQNSGVSARMTISLMENVVSNAERRGLLTGEETVVARLSDLFNAATAITGKIELVYEGEREGVRQVALHVIGKAVRQVFVERFPDPLADRDGEGEGAYAPILAHFQKGGTVDVSDELSASALFERLGAVPGLGAVAREHLRPQGEQETAAAMEFVLEGLHQASLLAKEEVLAGRVYSDPLDEMARSLGRE